VNKLTNIMNLIKKMKKLSFASSCAMAILINFCVFPLSSLAGTEDSLKVKCLLSLNDGPTFDEKAELVHEFDTFKEQKPVSIKKNQNPYEVQALFKDQDFRGDGGGMIYFALNHFKDEDNGGVETISAGVYFISRSAGRKLHRGEKEVYNLENKYGGQEALEPYVEIKVPAGRKSFEFTVDQYVKVDQNQERLFTAFSCEVLSD